MKWEWFMTTPRVLRPRPGLMREYRKNYSSHMHVHSDGTLGGIFDWFILRRIE